MSTATLTRDQRNSSPSPEGMTTATLPGTEGTVFSGRLRGVSAIRLSVLTDETTSPERQREANERAAEMLNISFGEDDERREAVDLDVSASKTAPWERPELGRWLADPDSFDVIVWWRFDRAVRSQGHMHELAKWASEHRKMIVFAEGVGGGQQTFDFRNPLDPVTRMMLNQFAFAAEMEAWSIKERVTGAMAAMRKMPFRFKGGRPSYGYKIIPMPAEHGGVGKTLAQDESAVKIIIRIIRDLLSGKTITRICQELEHDQVPTPRDHWSVSRGRKTGGKTGGAKGETNVRDVFKWVPTVLRKILTNPALLGWKMHNASPIRDAQGEPIMSTEQPILTREEFDVVGKFFDDRRMTEPRAIPTDASKLLRVIHCGTCGSRMYHQTNRKQQRAYTCGGHLTRVKCASPMTIRADWVEDYVEREFLAMTGRIRIQRTVITPGYDPAQELAHTLAEFEAHQEEKGRQKSNTAKAAWQARADALDNRMALLENTPARPEVREKVDTDETFADLWGLSDDDARRLLMLDAGARLEIRKGVRGGWRTLDERRVSFTVAGDLDPAIESWAGLRDELSMTPEGAPVAGSRVRLAEPAAA
ncbi:recombinase family protein [Kitasatospora sp. NPDC094016]|uniref:recombinase family protein n=1 Tax=Kitasatospora sp. NPDC094016 TaxID=3154986 RepID=UPI00331F8A28